MQGHPVRGIKGAKAPKPENGKSRLSSRPGPRIAQLSEEYIELRNRAQLAKAEAAEIALLEKKGTLISRKLVGMQSAYLLTIFRQRALLAPAAMARRLANLALVDPAKEHAVSEAIKEDIHILLTELSNLPGQVTDPNWFEKIDPDLLKQVDGGESQEPRMTPVEARAAIQKAKTRRRRKAETQRQRRAEGRA